MYYDKRDYPFAILPELDLLFEKISKSNVIFSSKNVAYIQEKKARFYIWVKAYEYFDNKYVYIVDISPESKFSNFAKDQRYNIIKLLAKIDEWENLIDSYDDYIPYGTIEESYFEEFFNDFEFIDEDDVKPFHTQLQPLLSKSIDAQIKYLEAYIETNVDINKDEIEEIVEDFKQLNDDISKVTKRGFIKRWSKIASKIAKTGHKTLKEAKTEMVKEAYKMVLRYTVENWHSIQNGATKLIGEGGDFIVTLLT